MVEFQGDSRPTPNFFVRALLRHYGNTELVRSESEVLADEWIFGGCMRFRRAYVVPVAVLTQFCCGSLYAWSVLNKPIDSLIYGNEKANMASITFFISVGCFGFSAALFGPWIERSSPRRPCTVGALLFLIGNLISALALGLKQIWLLYIGYGIIGSAGLGVSYVATTSLVQKWYPTARGLAAGFAVCGFGGGSLAFTKVRVTIYNSTSLWAMMLIEASIFGVIMLLGAQFLRPPPPHYNTAGLALVEDDKGRVQRAFMPGKQRLQEDTEQGVDGFNDERPVVKITLIQAVTSRDYWVLYFVFFCNQFFGLVVISRLSNMAQDLFYSNANSSQYVEDKREQESKGSTLVVLIGLFNAFGRLFIAALSDWLGRKNTFVLMLGSQIALIIGLSLAIRNNIYWAFLMCSWMATFMYGGGFGTIPAFLADMFGPSNVSSCHGLILTAWSIGGVVGGLAYTAIFNKMVDSGRHLNDPAIYTDNLIWILVIMCLGFLLMPFLRAKLRDRLFPEADNQLFRARVFGRIVRVTTKPLKIEMLSKIEEDTEWEEFMMMAIIRMRMMRQSGPSNTYDENTSLRMTRG
ncbi:MFS general substrate transporter [Ramicandelaber brevisporus]|nr:MFS general substrate transporter [Ramicandelaber brevisporus]